MSSFLFAQVKKNNEVTFMKSGKVTKEINSIKNGTKALIDSIHYDGEYDDAIGLVNGGEFGAYMVITGDNLITYSGLNLTDVKTYINDAAQISSIEIRLYTDTTGTPAYTQPFVPVDGWNLVNLSTPFALPATGYLVVGYHVSTPSGVYPAGIDAGPSEPNGYGDVIYINGWQNMAALGTPINWNIRAMIGGEPTGPIAKISSKKWAAGYVKVGESTSNTFTLTNIGVGTLTSSGISGISAPFTTTFNPASVSLGTGANITFDIAFTPTDENITVQTAAIATNATNLEISLSGKGFNCDNPISTFPWTEDFEYGISPCYTILDEDEDGDSWFYNTIWEAHNGTGLVSSFSWNSYVGALTPDNWLITPAFDFSDASKTYSLSYFVKGQDPNYSTEHYGIFVSTTNTDPASFTMIFDETLPAGTGTYLEKGISLDAYKGNTTVYIAFRHFNSTDIFAINIDDITVDGKVGVAENEKSFGIYPNPANDYVKVYTSELSNITITDIRGSVVYAGQVNNNDIISTKNFMSGLYIVTIETKDNISRTKLIIN